MAGDLDRPSLVPRRAVTARACCRRCRLAWIAFLLPAAAGAQPISQRGFIEGRDFLFPQTAPNDATRNVGDLLAREEVFLKPAEWFQIAGGLDLRANSHDQVESAWRFDWDDRAIQRPRLALRRLAVTVSKGPLTIEAGKAFIRWARADVLNPTDRFAPRDFLNVLDTDVLPVIAVHPSLRVRNETFEAVWSPQLTPSRLPLFNQRWTVLPPAAQGIPIADGGSILPHWIGAGRAVESCRQPLRCVALVLRRLQPPPEHRNASAAGQPRADARVSLAAELRRRPGHSDAVGDAEGRGGLLHVSDIDERRVRALRHRARAPDSRVGAGGWLRRRGGHGESRRVFIRAGSRHREIVSGPGRLYRRSRGGTIAIEAAVRQSGDGLYVKGEYSQAFAQHWRLTLTGVGIEGQPDDFLGQFNHNSNLSIGLRFSF
jgi:hypothetical protein